jgi:hypothetical protein
MARVLEVEDNKPVGKAVWYKPLDSDVKQDLSRYAVGDHVIVRLRLSISGVHDTIVKVTSALETHGPALANTGKTGKPARRDPSKPTAADRAEVARQDAEIAQRPAHSGYLSEDDEPEDAETAPVVAQTGKKSRKNLQPDRTTTPDREDALARLKDTARENVFTPEPKPVKLSCPFCNGPTHETQDAELLCMNATRFSRKRRRNRGTEKAADDDE